jgi:hypothetical protein
MASVRLALKKNSLAVQVLRYRHPLMHPEFTALLRETITSKRKQTHFLISGDAILGSQHHPEIVVVLGTLTLCCGFFFSPLLLFRSLNSTNHVLYLCVSRPWDNGAKTIIFAHHRLTAADRNRDVTRCV